MNYQEWWDSHPRAGWADDAVCRGMATEVWFSNHAGPAKKICRSCPVADDCLVDTMRSEYKSVGERHGIFGGMTKRERHRLYTTLRRAGVRGL